MARELELEIVIKADRAKQDLRETQTALDNITSTAIKADTATEELNKAFVVLTQKSERLKTEIKGYDTQLKASTDQTTKATTAAKAHDVAVANQTRSTGLLSSAVVRYASGAAVIAAIKGTADWADRLDELSVQTGFSITALQKLDKIAKLNGSTAEQLAQSFSIVQDRIGGGDKSVVRAFDKLGLSIDAFKKLNPEQQILQLADAITRVEDPSQKANIAIDIFGKTGARLIPVLDQISKGYDDITVASDTNVKAIGQLSDWWETAKGAGAILITGALAPLVRMYELLAEAVYAVGSAVGSVTSSVGLQSSKLWGLLWPPKGVMDAWDELLSGIDVVRGRLDIPKLPGELLPPNNGGVPPLGPGGVSGLDPKSSTYLDDFAKLTGIYQQQVDLEIKIGQERQRAADQAAKEQEQAAERAERELERELKAYQAILDVNRQRTAAAQQVLGQDFLLFQGSQLTPRGDFLRSPTNDAWWSLFTEGAVTKPPIDPATLARNRALVAQQQAAVGAGFTWSGYNPNGQLDKTPRWIRSVNGLQSQWRESNFSKDNFAGTALGYAEGLQDLAQNGDPIWNATDRMGRGARAGAGALAGAQTGMKYGGPYGAIGGAVIGAIVGAARNPAFEDVFNRVAVNFGQAISEETARGIAKTAKESFGGDRQAAEIFDLDKILADGGLNDKNIDKMLARLRDAFSMKEMGKFTQEQLTEVLDENFGTFAAYFDEIGGLADEKFTEIIKLQRAVGVESAAVTQYVGEQVTRVVGGLEQFLSNATIKSAASATALMGAAVLAFDELRKGPEGIRGAVEAMAPVINTINEQLAGLGVEASATFNDMRSLLGSLTDEDFVRAIDAVDGLNEVMIGLHNAALLDQETFAGLALTVTETFNDLVAQGKDGDQALRLMQPTLQTIWELQTKFGYTVDEGTQALLDQAKAAGVVGEEWMSAQDQMVDVLKDVRDTLGEIRDAMLGVGDAAEDAAQQTQDAWNEVSYPTPPGGPTGEPDNPEGYAAMGGYVTARGIRYMAAGGVLYPRFMARGSDTVPAMLTPGEGVLNLRGMRTLGALNRGETPSGGNTFHITIAADTRQGGRDAADGFMEEMRRRGVKLSAA